MLLRYPQIIHAELMTHRVFSRNAASSRAIPIDKMIESVEKDPFIPLVWFKNVPGMQGKEELSFDERRAAELIWRGAIDDAIRRVRQLTHWDVHKQIVNRLLGPFMHITVVVTATQWSNWFALRIHPKAEPHICMLAQKMRDAMDENTPRLLEINEWHLPFVDRADHARMQESLIKLSVARCASTSYKTVDGFDMTLERAAKVYDSLLKEFPIHASPAEHQARPDRYDRQSDEANMWVCPHLHGNLEGWIQYRKTLAGECS